MERIPVAGPSITQKEIDYVTDAVTNCWYGEANRYHDRFERAFAEFLGVKYAVALPSCTSAIHLALAALGIGPGDEVVVPDITWIASAAPISYLGATPVFADVDSQSWCLAPESLEAVITPRTKAVIPVDLYGNVPDMNAIREIAARRGLHVIEDAAEAIGSQYRGRQAGSLGDVGVFSFHGSKTVTTGEGGMLVTDHANIYERVLLLRDHGRRPTDKMFWNSEVAYKYKMSSMQAALGLAQLERIGELAERKREIFAWYCRAGKLSIGNAQSRIAGCQEYVLDGHRSRRSDTSTKQRTIDRADVSRTDRLPPFLLSAQLAAGLRQHAAGSPCSTAKQRQLYPEPVRHQPAVRDVRHPADGPAGGRHAAANYRPARRREGTGAKSGLRDDSSSKTLRCKVRMPMTGHSPLVSIGLPVYNGLPQLEEALSALLAQDGANFELIISDNASTDGTGEYCRRLAAHDPRIRYRRNAENIGAMNNFTAVLQCARGQYFMWAAHDDRWSREFVSSLAATLDATPDAVLATPIVIHINDDGSMRNDPVDRPAAGESGIANLRLLCADHAVSWIYGL